MDLKVKKIGEITYINVTPHPLNFLVNGELLILEPSGIIINADVIEKPVEKPGCIQNGIQFVTTQFVGDAESYKLLDEIEKRYPGSLVIGSIIAAQAYPGRIVAMTPMPGYERVEPGQKRMNPFKFTIYIS